MTWTPRKGAREQGSKGKKKKNTLNNIFLVRHKTVKNTIRNKHNNECASDDFGVFICLGCHLGGGIMSGGFCPGGFCPGGFCPTFTEMSWGDSHKGRPMF